HAVQLGQGLLDIGRLTEPGKVRGEFGVCGTYVGGTHGNEVLRLGTGCRSTVLHTRGDHTHVAGLGCLLHDRAGEATVAELVDDLTFDRLVETVPQRPGRIVVQGVTALMQQEFRDPGELV